MLEIKNIQKVYPSGRGLHELSLTIESGEIVSLVGPNGSGKSTALNIIAGIQKSDAGQCLLNGLNTLPSETKRYIGFLEESPFFYGKMTVVNFLNFIWQVKYPNLENGELFRLLDQFGLADMQGLKMRELSMGLRQRVGLVSALMGFPPLIILDEPTNGLDTRGVLCLKEEISAARALGCIIILSSHILDFVKSVCTRIVFLKDGYSREDLFNHTTVNLDEAYKRIYDREESASAER